MCLDDLSMSSDNNSNHESRVTFSSVVLIVNYERYNNRFLGVLVYFIL